MNLRIFYALFTIVLSSLLMSCNSFIDELPKGKLVPTTLADYEAFLREEYNVNYLPGRQALYLINDKFIESGKLNSDNLDAANYLWKEDRDRLELNSSTEDMFEFGYGIIAIANTIIEDVPNATEATAQEKNEVIAYAHAIRAFTMFQIVNFYADAYDPVTADKTPGVPIIYSGNLNSPNFQGTVKEVYDLILSDFNKAIELGVPENSMTIIHPSRAAVEAGLARVYLTMRDYDNALKHAQEALDRKSDLFNWFDYYNQYKSRIEDETDYNYIASPLNHGCVENYWFCSGNANPNQSGYDVNISQDRASLFEEGDMKFLVRWKKKQFASDVAYQGLLNGYFNCSGIMTPEVYLIKAECQARAGKIDDAMKTLNTVRKSRIHPDFYEDATAANEAEAIEKIRKTKNNDLVGTIFPFIDIKRYNAEGKYPVTLRKVWNDQTYTLSPNSHMWTMPFPANAIKRPGNGTLTQNVDK